jgi:quercetin dioxygenase-like cupin family protein
MKVLLAVFVVGALAQPVPSEGRQETRVEGDLKGVTAVNPAEIKWTQAPGMTAGMMTALQYGDTEKGPYQVLIKFPANTVVQPHFHKYDEFATVISGTVLLGQGDTVDESKATEVSAGGYLMIPAGTAHWAKCKADAIIVRFCPGPRELTPIKEGVKAPGTAPVQVTPAKDVKWEQAPGMPEGIKTVLQYGDPAKGPYLILLRFPHGTLNPAHWHTADEAVTILQGTMITGEGRKLGDGKALEVSPGGYFIIPGKTPHWGQVTSKEDVILTRLGNGPRDITYFDKK